jgi:DNA polymerase III delta subunit
MLYVLHGSDFVKRGKKLDEMVQFFLTKKPNTSFAKVNAGDFSNYSLDELAGGQGLFENKCVVVLDGIFENKETKEIILKKLDSLGKSNNVFVINERALLKGDLAALLKHSEKIQEFLLKEKMARPEFNIFSLSDAIGARDKKRAWTLYLRALENGSEPEEIHGTIFWAVKNMALVKDAKQPTAESTGLKPFVLGKAKSSANNYSKKELNDFSSRLVSLYHDSHRGIGDFSAGLEKLILETL